MLALCADPRDVHMTVVNEWFVVTREKLINLVTGLRENSRGTTACISLGTWFAISLVSRYVLNRIVDV